jgi:hypothetical protein
VIPGPGTVVRKDQLRTGAPTAREMDWLTRHGVPWARLKGWLTRHGALTATERGWRTQHGASYLLFQVIILLG